MVEYTLKCSVLAEVGRLFRPVLWEQQGHIGYIRLNRPEHLNALNYDMLAALGEIVAAMRESRAISAW